ncbi:response regulator [Larkinella terrae]|uniref:Response regulator n=1 Tax=Larkinella terrae TaxID=2025311 RepID=A0A7K0EFE1_9BACT|nr:response regulator [Larkinella terrae]MRS60178.1 response regulator [Larkinella terrae]
MAARKLLLIEDEPQLRLNTADLLELSGYRVQTAGSGKEGVQLALTDKPDLVLCDVMMPGLDGYGVLQIFSHHPDLMAIPFIFLTAKAERADLRKGMELGADDYLTKPFGEAELIGAIETRLRLADQRRSPANTAHTLGDFLNDVQHRDGLASLAANRVGHPIKRRKVIYAEGDDPTKIYFVQSGKVRTQRENAEGKELVTGLYGPGDFFGYTALLENRSYEDTALALEDSTLCYIPKDDFLNLLFCHADVARSFIKLLANTIADQERQLLGLAYNSLRKRVASGLLKYVRRFQAESGTALTVSLTREELGMLSGTATESLIRTLGDFRDEGIIDLRDGKIVVTDPGRLERLKW